MANKRPDARAILFERIRTSPPKFVHLVGVPYQVELEQTKDPEALDHLWITLEVPPFGRLRAVVNTLSRLSREAGVDSRVHVAVLASTYTVKPLTGLEECSGFDYAKIEGAEKLVYTPMERDALSDWLLIKARQSIRVEVWGELYARDHIGLHQIHCRRASASVKQELRARDGALKLYFPQENTAELLLFKFAGQR